LPEKDDAIEKLADELKVTIDDLHTTIASLHEINPMLGHRGCRLGITYPEIYEMQVHAICEAAIEVSAKGEFKVNVEIEIPLICEEKELIELKEMAKRVVESYGPRVNFNYKIGTMIELPRACLIADDLAKHAEFMSFGTNDLTQTTYGISRDDVGHFIPVYLDKGIFDRDPAAGIDEKGVGKLMEMCVKLAKSARADIEIGICGEQGGDPASVWFCEKIGLDYVSCSPFRVPVARLAAAQAEVRRRK
jgi:pyruvate,orthophosphate dikinase